MNPFDELQHEVQLILKSVSSGSLYGPVTTFTPYIILIILLVLVVVLTAKKQLSLVPKNRYVGVIEFFVDFTNKQIGQSMMGEAARQHMPFLLTLFIFILFSNLVGLIPGSKAATGTMGTTVTLAAISFAYFTYCGVKKHGGLHYLASLAPKGLPGPLAVFIWLLEFISMLIRLLTLSVRLFANMFAGHLLIGILAVLVTLFVQPLIHGMGLAALPMSFAGLGWMTLLIISYTLEVFVACLQAYVFTLLTSFYIFSATSGH